MEEKRQSLIVHQKDKKKKKKKNKEKSPIDKGKYCIGISGLCSITYGGKEARAYKLTFT